ncbi:hypothetical protein [Paenibacillus sp. DMB20]|uniref:hypothetical protein n=1 Tax=Paenibacillus sp. DMB20 TaxID=1642570 RepID=UPI0006274A85|nr:hypothetical protein [Paenibacillus sp. DMB20]KKO52731.1 hypothetical protein XI25_18085 [Paenibacillus sp. DMB20]
MVTPTLMDNKFMSLITCTEEAGEKFGASAASIVIIQDNKILTEWYSGKHHFKNGILESIILRMDLSQ